MTHERDRAAEYRFETLAVGTTSVDASNTPDVVSPIHLSSTFEWGRSDSTHEYGRESNPTRSALEAQLAQLEGADHGLAFASGMGAISTAILSVVPPGGHLVSSDSIYGGTEAFLRELVADSLGVTVTFVDARDPDAVAAAVGPGTDAVWVESPTNPLLRLCDIRAIADVLTAHDAVLGVDSTFASPYFQDPLELGADIVVHSTTKYLNGHSDSIGGAVLTDDDDIFEQLSFTQRIGLGNVLSPFDCYLVSRGIKTLPARMQRHETNAMAVAELLDAHDRVSRVRYPGLETHPQHALAAEQMSGYSGMVSFELEGGPAALEAFIDRLELFTPGASLGGVESLVEVPSLMIPDTLDRGSATATIPDTLVRLSVGIEHPEDLCADIRSALR